MVASRGRSGSPTPSMPIKSKQASKRGVLKVTLPKRAEAVKAEKRIPTASADATNAVGEFLRQVRRAREGVAITAQRPLVAAHKL